LVIGSFSLSFLSDLGYFSYSFYFSWWEIRKYYITTSVEVAQVLRERQHGDSSLLNWIYADGKGILYFSRPSSKLEVESLVLRLFLNKTPQLFRLLFAYLDWNSNGLITGPPSSRCVEAFSPFASQSSLNDSVFAHFAHPVSARDFRVSHVDWFNLLRFPPDLDPFVNQITRHVYDSMKADETGHDMNMFENSCRLRGHTVVCLYYYIADNDIASSFFIIFFCLNFLYIKCLMVPI
jgi:hypothetical protein